MDNRTSSEVDIDELRKFWDDMHENPSFEAYSTIKFQTSFWFNEIMEKKFSISKDKDDKSFERVDRVFVNYDKYEAVITTLYGKLNPSEQKLADAKVSSLLEEARANLKKRE